MFTKKDFYFSIATGLITGFSAWRIFEYLNVPEIGEKVVYCIKAPCPPIGGVSWSVLVFAVPILWVLGVNLGYFLGRWFNFFNQFGKFATIGFTNAAVDFGVLNLLIANTDISSGGWYSVFKAISFIAAVIPSYFWNKYWAFSVSGGEEGERSLPDGRQGFEFAKFTSVAVVSIFINTGTASLMVNYMDPVAGLSPAVWANAGAVAGSAVALVFSFIGFKVAVFKK